MISDEKATVTRRYTVTADEIARALSLKGRPWKIEKTVGRGPDKWVILTSEDIDIDD